MSRLPSPATHHGGPLRLPTVVEELLLHVVADGFTLYCCGPRTAPNALVASYEWADYVDLLTVRDFARVITARVPKRGRHVDIFAPEVVVWAYEAAPHLAVRALLNLVHPAHPAAPTLSYPAPARLRVPRAQQRPMTIQPPSPGLASTRAARLAAAIAADRVISAGTPTATPDPGWPPVELAAPDARLPAAGRSPTKPVIQEVQ
ncbi:MAG: hypothetical protein ACRDRA_02140 [Pseudonocardiaceae bacterium]